MSLSRLALRLAAVEALRPSTPSEGWWPTIAGDQIWDSRIDPIADADLQGDGERLDRKPLVIVYTEEHESEAATGSQFPPQFEFVELSCEIFFATLGIFEVNGPEGPVQQGGLTAAVTDPDREALLDTLESQIRRVFDTQYNWPTAELFRQVAWEVRAIRSLPDRTPDRATKFLRRSVRFRCKVPYETWPPFAVTPAPVGFAALPQPLAKLAAALPEGSVGARSCERIAALISQGADFVPLSAVRIAANLFPSDAARTAATPPTSVAVAAETTGAPINADANTSGT